MKRITIKVHGRVQGVFFRASSKKKADQLGLTGWVENEDDGACLIVVEGRKEKLTRFLDWLRDGGPTFAKTDNIDVEWEEGGGEFTNFTIRY